eukprot:scaffold63024_cov68-Phaeocystis_antarctica.AAC.5
MDMDLGVFYGYADGSSWAKPEPAELAQYLSVSTIQATRSVTFSREGLAGLLSEVRRSKQACPSEPNPRGAGAALISGDWGRRLVPTPDAVACASSLERRPPGIGSLLLPICHAAALLPGSQHSLRCGISSTHRFRGYKGFGTRSADTKVDVPYKVGVPCSIPGRGTPARLRGYTLVARCVRRCRYCHTELATRSRTVGLARADETLTPSLQRDGGGRERGARQHSILYGRYQCGEAGNCEGYLACGPGKRNAGAVDIQLCSAGGCALHVHSMETPADRPTRRVLQLLSCLHPRLAKVSS